MLNASSYVAPARMKMKALILDLAQIDNKSLSDLMHEKWTRNEQLRGGVSAVGSTSVDEGLVLGNECLVGRGEQGYLGPTRVHYSTPQR
jgi:hypothetical protein